MKTVNKGGKITGNATTEFFKGVAEGYGKSLQCKMKLSDEIINKGMKTGKFTIDDARNGSKDNLISVYLIFDKDFDSDITVKVSDKNNLEIGRITQKITAKANQSKYYDFVFDRRAQIEPKSKIEIY